MLKSLLIVFLLGFSSGLPLSLVSSTLQAWFADAGASVWITGWLSLIGLPYLFRFLWAPILDYYNILGLGKRRSWIVLMQFLISGGLLLLAQSSPQQSPWLIAALTFFIATCSATQDAAIDAHRAEYLPIPLHGIGAAVATLAYRIALLLSGGLALVIAEQYGWKITYRLMSGGMILGVLAILLSSEPSRKTPENETLLAGFIEPVRELFTRKEFFFMSLFLVLYKLGEVFTSSISGIVMPFFIQGLHFSLSTIGYVTKIGGMIAIIMGGLTAGIVLIRYSLYQSLMAFGLLQAVTNGLFFLLTVVKPTKIWLIFAVVTDNFATGMETTALVALLMRFVDQRYTATQFSILAALLGMPRVLSGPIGAYLQAKIDWFGLYAVAFISAFAFIPILYHLRTQPAFRMKKYPHN